MPEICGLRRQFAGVTCTGVTLGGDGVSVLSPQPPRKSRF